MLNYNKILLVDDDTSFLNIYNKILKFNEYEVVICNNPELAENLVDVNEEILGEFMLGIKKLSDEEMKVAKHEKN